MQLHSINTAQRLYVMRSGQGFSCYGFDVLDRKAKAAYAWCAGDAPNFGTPGTAAHFAMCDTAIEEAAAYAIKTRKKCPVELHPQLVGLEGHRVEVIDADGDTDRFIVGRSTGWMPVHLRIHNRRSHGGPAVDSRPFQSVRSLYVAR